MATSSSVIYRPTTIEEISLLIRDASSPVLTGVGRGNAFGLPTECKNGTRACIHLDLTGFEGVVSFEPADQVVVVRAGTSFAALNEVLVSEGQCLPILLPPVEGAADVGSSIVGEALSLNLPHTLEAQCGMWRDWVLGLTVVQADGTVAHCGSMAVKNVAGYDVQKLLIGARETLGVVAEVILRTFPTAALPKPDVVQGPGRADSPVWIQRVLPTDFERALANAEGSLILADRATATLWCGVEPESELPRFAGDWVVRSGCGVRNLSFSDPTQIRLMRRAKELFDPTGKLNPGEMGIL